MPNIYYEKQISYHFRPSADRFLCFQIEKIDERYTDSRVLITAYYCGEKEAEETYNFDNELKKWKRDKYSPTFDEAFKIEGLSEKVLNYLNDHGTPFDKE